MHRATFRTVLLAALALIGAATEAQAQEGYRPSRPPASARRSSRDTHRPHATRGIAAATATSSLSRAGSQSSLGASLRQRRTPTALPRVHRVGSRFMVEAGAEPLWMDEAVHRRMFGGYQGDESRRLEFAGGPQGASRLIAAAWEQVQTAAATRSPSSRAVAVFEVGRDGQRRPARRAHFREGERRAYLVRMSEPTAAEGWGEALDDVDPGSFRHVLLIVRHEGGAHVLERARPATDGSTRDAEPDVVGWMAAQIGP
jgi:hypothetical protein